jgi:hypothetical protein
MSDIERGVFTANGIRQDDETAPAPATADEVYAQVVASGKVGREAEDMYIALSVNEQDEGEDDDQGDEIDALPPAADQALAAVVRAEVQSLGLAEHEEAAEFIARYEARAAVIREAVA